MLKLKAAFIALAIIIALCGCVGEPSSTEGFSAKDLVLTIGGNEYRCDTDIQEIISVLGDDFQYSEGRSCAYDGLDKTFIYETVEFYTYPTPNGDLVSEICTYSPDITTTKGLGVGSTRDEVLAAYGDDCEDIGHLLSYKIPAPREELADASLCFLLEDGKVSGLWITAETAIGE